MTVFAACKSPVHNLPGKAATAHSTTCPPLMCHDQQPLCIFSILKQLMSQRLCFVPGTASLETGVEVIRACPTQTSLETTDCSCTYLVRTSQPARLLYYKIAIIIMIVLFITITNNDSSKNGNQVVSVMSTGVFWMQSTTDKLSRPYRTSPDQVVSVGRSGAGLTATGKAVADKSASSSGASTSSPAAGSKSVGGIGNLTGASTGKLSTSIGAAKR